MTQSVAVTAHAPLQVLVRAIKVLEGQGKAKLFKGAAGDDEGIKFFTAAG